jgi:hypothetical protein
MTETVLYVTKYVFQPFAYAILANNSLIRLAYTLETLEKERLHNIGAKGCFMQYITKEMSVVSFLAKGLILIAISSIVVGAMHYF